MASPCHLNKLHAAKMILFGSPYCGNKTHASVGHIVHSELLLMQFSRSTNDLTLKTAYTLITAFDSILRDRQTERQTCCS